MSTYRTPSEFVAWVAGYKLTDELSEDEQDEARMTAVSDLDGVIAAARAVRDEERKSA